MSAIKIENLYYSLKAHFWSKRLSILKGVNLEVEEGQIFGFLGPNGAGKTTTIRILLNLLRQDQGNIEIFGADPRKTSTRKHLGFLPEHAYFPEYLSGYELLVQQGQLAGLNLKESKSQAHDKIEEVGLSTKGDVRLRNYSKGMLQRIGIGQALMGDPRLIILDEPMSGLDPLGRRDIRELMFNLKKQGKTVFFSTHILPDVELICDCVALLMNGQIKQQGALENFLSPKAHSGIVVRVRNLQSEHLAHLEKSASSVERRGEECVVKVKSMDEANTLIDRVRGWNGQVIALKPIDLSLEDIFVQEVTQANAESNS